MQLYEENAKLIINDIEIIGRENIKNELQKFLQLGAKMKIQNRVTTQFENIALLGSIWVIEFDNKEGETLKMKGFGSEIVRKQAYGTWLFIIDNPNGGK